ncbi:MAG TPA: hypothetical protein VHO84_12645 [Syntrophorhabdaceae bacterium]|nr:hypothetical protein [Syntrophorhabdaceae bacterium]
MRIICKTACVSAICVLLFSRAVFGVPFLVSDPYPAKSDRPVKFLVTINGRTEVTEPTRNSDGTVYLKYDLANCEDGSFTAVVKAVDAKGGESPSATLSFRKSGMTAEIFAVPQAREKIPPSRQYQGHLRFLQRPVGS